MNDYEPRERTPEWERLIDAHNAAAKLAAYTEEERNDSHGWLALKWLEPMLFASAAGLAFGFPFGLYRNGVCVAQWKAFR